MKKIILILITFLLINNVFGQNAQFIKSKTDSINRAVKIIELEITNLYVQKQSLKNELSILNEVKNKSELEEESLKPISTKTDFLGGTLKDSPSMTSNSIVKIPANESILIYNWYKKPFFKASYNDKVGYINKASLKLNEELKSIVDKNFVKNNPKLAQLTKRFGSNNAKRILKGQYWIGMTSAMARESLGYPDVNNKNTYSWGIKEQWVYNNKKRLYLYFENGELMSYQN